MRNLPALFPFRANLWISKCFHSLFLRVTRQCAPMCRQAGGALRDIGALSGFLSHPRLRLLALPRLPASTLRGMARGRIPAGGRAGSRAFATAGGSHTAVAGTVAFGFHISLRNCSIFLNRAENFKHCLKCAGPGRRPGAVSPPVRCGRRAGLLPSGLPCAALAPGGCRGGGGTRRTAAAAPDEKGPAVLCGRAGPSRVAVWWRRGESNSRPRKFHAGLLQA